MKMITEGRNVNIPEDVCNSCKKYDASPELEPCRSCKATAPEGLPRRYI